MYAILLISMPSCWSWLSPSYSVPSCWSGLSPYAILLIMIVSVLQYSILLIMIVSVLQYSILLFMLVGTAMKYMLHTIDLQNENPWENKMVYLLYTDVVLGEWVISMITIIQCCLGFLKVSLYFAFMSFMIMVHMFPLYIMRRTYLSVKWVSICLYLRMLLSVCSVHVWHSVWCVFNCLCMMWCACVCWWAASLVCLGRQISTAAWFW